MDEATDVPKVLVYVVRRRNGRDELLVHEHRDAPGAGVQVPAGTIEPGERPADAATRELFEESGLRVPPECSLRPVREYRWFNSDAGVWHRRHVFVLRVHDARDCWEHAITGAGEDRDMVFIYRWVPLADAKHILCGDQGGSVESVPPHAEAVP